MEYSAMVLGLAALGGLTVATMRLSGIPRPPTWMALGHGTVAAVGLLLLVQAVMLSPGAPVLAQAALGILVVAALGGTFMFVGYHMKGLPLPIFIMIGHGLMALAGLGTLLTAIYR